MTDKHGLERIDTDVLIEEAKKRQKRRMIQFDKKISIDGVAVIIIGVSALAFILNTRSDVDHLKEVEKQHAEVLQKLTDTTTALQINVSVLTAISKQDHTTGK